MVGVADADADGSTLTVESIQGVRRPGDGAFRLLALPGRPERTS